MRFRGRSAAGSAELGTVARRQRAKIRRVRRPRLGRAWLLVVVVGMGFLYYRPLETWLETRAELGRREAEVRSLRADRLRLEGRLSRAETMEALGREARRIGYVRPGERLFIVKGIPQWQRRNVAGGR
jgi:Septum formation initiator